MVGGLSVVRLGGLWRAILRPQMGEAACHPKPLAKDGKLGN